MSVAQAIIAAAKKVGAIKKTKVPGLPYPIISDETVLSAVRPAMLEAGLIITPSAVEVLSHATVKTSRAEMTHLVMKVCYQVFHDDSFIEVESIGEAMDSSDKCAAKCLTMARKSLFRQLFMLESDDPEFVRPEVSSTQPAPF